MSTTAVQEPLFSPSAQYMDAGTGYVTEWEDKSCCGGICCCCRIAKFPVGNFYICGHWRTSLPKVCFAVLLFLASAIVFVYNLFIDPVDWLFEKKSLYYSAVILTTFSFLCLMIAYFNTLCKGPGYYPYTWSLSKRNTYTWREMMSGVAVYQEQVDWARSHDRPLRSSFSINARRFVMRADHFCAWTQSWIGGNNQKDFILTTFWCFMYLVFFIVSQIPELVFGYKEMISKDREVFHIIMTIILTLAYLVAFYLCGFALRHFYVAMRNLSNNQTITEKYNKKPNLYSKHSCIKNFEEICGSKWLILLWPFPFFPCIHATKTTWSDDELSQEIRDPIENVQRQSVLA